MFQRVLFSALVLVLSNQASSWGQIAQTPCKSSFALPTVNGAFPVTISNRVAASIEVRAQSFGPGLCSVTFRLQGYPHSDDQASFNAPPGSFSKWHTVGPAFIGNPNADGDGSTYHLIRDTGCDTGVFAEVRFFRAENQFNTVLHNLRAVQGDLTDIKRSDPLAVLCNQEKRAQDRDRMPQETVATKSGAKTSIIAEDPSKLEAGLDEDGQISAGGATKDVDAISRARVKTNPDGSHTFEEIEYIEVSPGGPERINAPKNKELGSPQCNERECSDKKQE